MYTKQLRSGAGSFTKLLRRIYPLPRFKEKSFLDRTGLAWTMSLNCPFNSEDFQIINDRAEIHFQRGAPYFQWKIDQLPVGDAAYLSVRKENGQLDAYFVLRRCSNGICEVCDWMVPEGKEEACRILKELSTFLRCFCSLITVNMVNPAGREPELLTASEFVRQEAQLPFLIYPTSKALSEEDLLQFKTLSNWSLRSIDADTILN